MNKKTIILLLTLMFVIAACGGTVPLSAPESAPVEGASPTPVTDPAPEASPTSTLIPDQGATVSVPGLRVMYLREGNLWSWADAGGSVQLTDTRDMSTIRVSPDGHFLAFMRGRDVWTVRMDGTDARLWDTQTKDGGALWFAPSGTLLAVSARDHIDVLDFETAVKTTLLTYAAIPMGYPEVVWTPDSSGFKTIIPAPVENGQAEMLFVFTSGTVASLAKFEMTGQPYLSPDGGYVIYAAKLGEGQESLHLMDSSGATRPYGEAAETVRVYGWLPDSKHFAFSVGSRIFLGDVGGVPDELSLHLSGSVRWVDNVHYLILQDGKLLLGDLTGATILLDSGVTEFDIALVN